MGRAEMVTSLPWGQLDSPPWTVQLAGSHGAQPMGLGCQEENARRGCGENARVRRPARWR